MVMTVVQSDRHGLTRKSQPSFSDTYDPTGLCVWMIQVNHGNMVNCYCRLHSYLIPMWNILDRVVECKGIVLTALLVYNSTVNYCFQISRASRSPGPGDMSALISAGEYLMRLCMWSAHPLILWTRTRMSEPIVCKPLISTRRIGIMWMVGSE